MATDQLEALRYCANCVIMQPPKGHTDALAILGAATGLVGIIIGFASFLLNIRAHDVAILREEFAQHRIRLESFLLILEQQQVTLRASSSSALPFPRVDQNFQQLYPETTKALGGIMAEAGRLDQRQMFGHVWVGSLQNSYTSIDAAFDRFNDTTKPDAVRQAEAAIIVKNIDQFSKITAELVEKSVIRRSFFGLKLPKKV